MDIVERLRNGSMSTFVQHDAADEIERLRQCLRWQQDRDATVGTHGPDCWSWGHRHYECALLEIEKLRERLEISPDHHIDGIEARDETIRLLEHRLAACQADAEHLRDLLTVLWKDQGPHQRDTWDAKAIAAFDAAIDAAMEGK